MTYYVTNVTQTPLEVDVKGLGNPKDIIILCAGARVALELSETEVFDLLNSTSLKNKITITRG